MFLLVPSIWKPKKGTIYAARQQELANQDDYHQLHNSLRKVKLRKEDEIKFPYYVDNDMHQKDIIKIIHKNTNLPRLLGTRWDANEVVPQEKQLCCCQIC